MRATVAVLLAITYAAACSTDRPGRGEDPKLLLDRIWIDRLPERHTEYAQVMLVLGDQPAGIFQKASSYDIHLEFFMYKRDGGKLAYRFPQSEKKGDLGYRISR